MLLRTQLAPTRHVPQVGEKIRRRRDLPASALKSFFSVSTLFRSVSAGLAADACSGGDALSEPPPPQPAAARTTMPARRVSAGRTRATLLEPPRGTPDQGGEAGGDDQAGGGEHEPAP